MRVALCAMAEGILLVGLLMGQWAAQRPPDRPLGAADALIALGWRLLPLGAAWGALAFLLAAGVLVLAKWYGTKTK